MIGIYIIKNGELVCDAVYLNYIANPKQWYTPYGRKWKKKIVRLNTINLTKVKLKSINYVAITAKASNYLRGDEIRLGAIYVCDYAHDEIMEIKISRE